MDSTSTHDALSVFLTGTQTRLANELAGAEDQGADDDAEPEWSGRTSFRRQSDRAAPQPE